MMRQIYEQAKSVLIIDAQLAEIDPRPLDCVEICARVVFSPWMRRLWTLQEGAVARKLRVLT